MVSGVGRFGWNTIGGKTHEAIKIKDLPAIIAMSDRSTIDEFPDELTDIRCEGWDESSDVE